MKVLSKLSDQCKKCSHVNNCNNKRMVACALAEMPKSNMKNSTIPGTTPLNQPMHKKTTSITINMGVYGNVNTSMEQIAEQFKKNFYKECNF